jgi:hypothetical protein
VPLRPFAHGIEASAARTKAALGARHAQLCTSAEGLHFFAGEAAGALVLPRQGEHEHLLDTKLAAVAAAEGAINAVPGCDTYVVVRGWPRCGHGARARACCACGGPKPPAAARCAPRAHAPNRFP